jgi:hypothetical protein
MLASDERHHKYCKLLLFSVLLLLRSTIESLKPYKYDCCYLQTVEWLPNAKLLSWWEKFSHNISGGSKSERSSAIFINGEAKKFIHLIKIRKVLRFLLFSALRVCVFATASTQHSMTQIESEERERTDGERETKFINSIAIALNVILKFAERTNEGW